MKQWYEIGIDQGNDEGTRTLESCDTLKEAKEIAKQFRTSGEKRPMFIDRWNEDGGRGFPEPDETFKAIGINKKGEPVK